MFETLAIFAGLTGGTSLVVGIARVAPELAIDSPMELLRSSIRALPVVAVQVVDEERTQKAAEVSMANPGS